MCGTRSDFRRVLLARRPERVARLAARLRDAGRSVDALSPIAFGPPRDPRAAVEAVLRVERYDRVAFTSPEGVRRFFAVRATLEVGPAGGPSTIPIRAAAVGRGTADALAAFGVSGVLRGSVADGAALADAFPEAPPEGRVLCVGPEASRPELAEGLREKGWRVDPIAFYRTVSSERVPEIARGLEERRWDTVLWASPSGVRAVAEAQPGVLASAAAGGVRFVAIGRTTAAALAEEDARAHVPEGPSDDDLFSAIVLPSDASGEDPT